MHWLLTNQAFSYPPLLVKSPKRIETSFFFNFSILWKLYSSIDHNYLLYVSIVDVLFYIVKNIGFHFSIKYQIASPLCEAVFCKPGGNLRLNVVFCLKGHKTQNWDDNLSRSSDISVQNGFNDSASSFAICFFLFLGSSSSYCHTKTAHELQMEDNKISPEWIVTKRLIPSEKTL